MTKISGPKGSNDGGVFQSTIGTKFYVKFYKNMEQGRTEALAAKIFTEMGVQTKTPTVAKVNGKDAIISVYSDDLEPMKPEDFNTLTKFQQQEAINMYVAAIVTKNWDVVGLEHDNIMLNKKTGNLVQVDPGGSFEFRAQGGAKEFGPDTAEYMTLRNPANPSGQVFNTILKESPELEHNALKQLASLNMVQIQGIFATSGVANQESLFKAFEARRARLLHREGL